MEPSPPPKGEFNIDEWEPDDPLWMTKVPEDPDSLQSNPALAALNNLMYEDQTPEEIAENFKEQGNVCFGKGKKYYKDAIMFYTKALEVPLTDAHLKKRAVYFANRAAVNLHLGNDGKVITDCDAALEVDPENVKAYFRASKAAISLKKYELAIDYCNKGLKVEPENKTLEREKVRAEKLLEELRNVERQKQQAIDIQNAKKLKVQQAIAERGIVVGPYHFEVQNRESAKVYLDDMNKLHWPVMFIYEEYSQVDYIEDFAEDATFDDHLAAMFPDNEYPDWDIYKKYSRDDIEIYAILNQVPPNDPTKKKSDKRPRKVKINHTSHLKKVLQHEEYVVPGTPVFYLISAKSSFKAKFIKMPIDSLMKSQ